VTHVSASERRVSLTGDGVTAGTVAMVRQGGRPRDREPGRRAFAALALAGVGAVLTACGKDDASGSAGAPTVSLAIPGQSLNFCQEVAEGFEFGVGTVNGIASRIGGPSFIDGAGQLRVFQDFMAQPSAGASLFTTNPEMFAGALADAARKGIPLIAVDNPPTSDAVGLFIGNDNIELGRRLADQIIAELPSGTKTGTVVLGTTSPGAFVLDQRAAGMRAEFRERMPGVTVLGPYDTGRVVEKNQGAWAALIKANPDALAFAGTGDPDALSLAALHGQTKGDWAAGAFDLEPQALLAVKRGDLVVVSPEHYLKGVLAGRLLAERAKRGTPLPTGWIRTPGLGVTAANIDEIIARQSSPAAKQDWFRAQTDRLLADPSPQQMPAV
jgi:ribose transport system substrate-binding protein